MDLPPPSLDVQAPSLSGLSLEKVADREEAYAIRRSTGDSDDVSERQVWYLLWPVLAPSSTPSTGDKAIAVSTGSDPSISRAIDALFPDKRVSRGRWLSRFGDFALPPNVRVRRSPSFDSLSKTTSQPSPHPPVDHPLRPSKDTLPTRLYTRWIPHLDRYLGLSIYPPPTDRAGLERLHGWLNDPRVDKYWQDRGSLDEHVGWLRSRIDDDRVLPVLGSFFSRDGEQQEPFGYFEMYWAMEDKIARFYPAGPYDRGLHMLVGSSAHRGAHRVQAWLPSLCHYLFLADERTARVVSEPDARNERMWRYLEAVGFESLGERDMGHKTARIMALERQSFYQKCPF